MRSVLIPLLLWATAAQAVPAQFTHQGRLIDADGVPLEDEVTLIFRVATAESGGDTLWEDTLTLPVENGFYSAILGADEDDNPLDVEILSEAPVWLEIQVDGEAPMFPRSPIQAVPYAAMAQVAEEVSGGPVDATEVAIDGGVVINDAGEWVGPAPSVSWSDIADIPADFADGVDDDTDTDTDSFADLGTSCLDGNIPVWDAVLAAWGCGTDAVLSEDAVDAFVADNGYAMTSEIFSGSFADLSDVPDYAMASDAFSGSFTDLSDVPDYAMASDAFSGSFSDLSDVPDYAMAADAFSGSFSDLSSVPIGLEDGDDDTQLTEDEVDAYVSNNGYASSSDVFSGSFDDLSDVPDDIDTPVFVEPNPLAFAHNVERMSHRRTRISKFIAPASGRYTRLQVRTGLVDAGEEMRIEVWSMEDERPASKLCSKTWEPTLSEADAAGYGLHEFDMTGMWGIGSCALVKNRAYGVAFFNYESYTQFHTTPWTTSAAIEANMIFPLGFGGSDPADHAWSNSLPIWFRLLP